MAPPERAPSRRRHPGGGGHRPHRADLAGHDQVHLLAAGPRGEDSELGRGPVDQVPGGRRGEPRGLLRPDFDHVRRLGGGPGAGVHQAPDPGWAGAGPPAREGPRTAPEGRPRAAGGDAANAGRRRQPPEDRLRLRVLGQHRLKGATEGGSCAMTTGCLFRTSTGWASIRLPAWAGPPLVGRDSSGAAKRILEGRFSGNSCRAGQIRLFRVILRKFIASRSGRTPAPPQPGCAALCRPCWATGDLFGCLNNRAPTQLMTVSHAR